MGIAGIDQTAQIVVGVFLAVIVLGIYASLTVFNTEEQDPTQLRMTQLEEALTRILQDTRDPHYEILFFELDDDHHLIGFDTNWNQNVNTVDGSNAYKPSECFDHQNTQQACICTYSNEWDVEESAKQGVRECVTKPFIGKTVVFVSEGELTSSTQSIGEPKEDSGFRYLAYDGDTWDNTKALKRIYVERTKQGNVDQIYISVIDELDENDPVLARKLEVDKGRSEQLA